MKSFLKYTLATIVGIILSGIIFFFLGVTTLFSVIASGGSETNVRKNSFLFLDLNGTITERTEENPFEQLLSDNFTNYGLDDILSSIKKAKENENIKGIYIQAGLLGTSFASLEEIRNALIDFKESGKFLVTYGDHYSQGFYYLTSISDKIMLNPSGAIEWKGLAGQPIFYKDLLEKIGIEMQIFKVGSYKSAVERFSNTKMSPENREQVEELLFSIWNRFLNDVAISRNMTPESLNELADRMLMFYPAEESVKAGLADTLVYKDGVRSYLKQLTDLNEKDNLRPVTLEEMINVKRNIPKDKSGNIIAVYYAFGDIDGLSDDGIDSKKVVRDLRRLREDENVKAVVLRVNSPGGSAYGSEQIWHELTLLRKEKPVITSMGDYAASGGYYISSATDWIVAQPTTLTGSIGIFGILPNVKGLADKVGLDFDIVKTNRFSDIGNLTRKLNQDERNLIQENINRGYTLFLTRCAEGRKTTIESIEKVAEGRVWTGEKAKELGLVDELGGLDRAIELAIERSGTENYTLLCYPAKKDFFSSLFEKKSSGIIEAKVKENFGELYDAASLINSLEKMDYIQARIPFTLNMR